MRYCEDPFRGFPVWCASPFCYIALLCAIAAGLRERGFFFIFSVYSCELQALDLVIAATRTAPAFGIEIQEYQERKKESWDAIIRSCLHCRDSLLGCWLAPSILLLLRVVSLLQHSSSAPPQLFLLRHLLKPKNKFRKQEIVSTRYQLKFSCSCFFCF